MIQLSDGLGQYKFSLRALCTDLLATAALSKAYRNEKDVDLRERILLVRLVREDKKEASSVAEKEFHRSRWWAYKWLKRFDNAGL